MPRTSKDPDVRRREIVDAAIRLFAAKGYANTTVNDLLDAVGIAKGTFYYHFASKEAALRAVVVEMAEGGRARAEAIAEDASRSAPDRVLAMLAAQRLPEDDAAIVASLHEAGNAEFHVLSLVATLDRLTPLLADVVRDGITDGVFDTPYPDESVAILLAAAAFMTDEGFEGYAPDPERVLPALLVAAERLFGAARGTFLDRAQQLGG